MFIIIKSCDSNIYIYNIYIKGTRNLYKRYKKYEIYMRDDDGVLKRD